MASNLACFVAISRAWGSRAASSTKTGGPPVKPSRIAGRPLSVDVLSSTNSPTPRRKASWPRRHARVCIIAMEKAWSAGSRPWSVSNSSTRSWPLRHTVLTSWHVWTPRSLRNFTKASGLSASNSWSAGSAGASRRRTLQGSGDLLEDFLTASATSLCNRVDGAPLGGFDDAEAASTGKGTGDLDLCRRLLRLRLLGKERSVALGVVDLELEAGMANQPLLITSGTQTTEMIGGPATAIAAFTPAVCGLSTKIAPHWWWNGWVSENPVFHCPIVRSPGTTWPPSVEDALTRRVQAVISPPLHRQAKPLACSGLCQDWHPNRLPHRKKNLEVRIQNLEPKLASTFWITSYVSNYMVSLPNHPFTMKINNNWNPLMIRPYDQGLNDQVLRWVRWGGWPARFHDANKFPAKNLYPKKAGLILETKDFPGFFLVIKRHGPWATTQKHKKLTYYYIPWNPGWLYNDKMTCFHGLWINRNRLIQLG